MERMLKYITSVILVSSALAQDSRNITNQFGYPEDVVTRQVGEINDRTQGIVRIYSADWCGPCKVLDKLVFDNTEGNPNALSFAERISQEGIVFQEIKNQHQNPKDKKTPRINEHIRKDAEFFRDELNGIPNARIYDTGKSFEGDREELAIRGIKSSLVEWGLPVLEKYIRRYALDEEISILSEEESKRVLEAIASNLFETKFGHLYEERIGFSFTPKDRNNSLALQTLGRLYTNGAGVKIGDERIIVTTPENIPKLPTDEQLEEVRVDPRYETYFQHELAYLKNVRDELNTVVDN